MKIFAYEFITGGGLLHDAIPRSLAIEGDMMLGALLGDLARIPGVEVMVSRDPRLTLQSRGVECMSPHAGEDPFVAFTRGASQCDAVLPIAPETGGVLEELSRIVLAEYRILLGCRPESISVAASKSRTTSVLSDAGIRCIPTFDSPERVSPISGPWVIKPDDGAGCADTSVVATWQDARGWLDARAGEGFIAQPWCEGTPLSLSMICYSGDALLLSCNLQHVRRQDARLELDGITVDAVDDSQGAYADLAARVAAALPGLQGYVGIDFIATDEGPVVLEINPRLTTSYCGLGAALGVNPAELIIAAASGDSGRASKPVSIWPRKAHPVLVDLHGAQLN